MIASLLFKQVPVSVIIHYLSFCDPLRILPRMCVCLRVCGVCVCVCVCVCVVSKSRFLSSKKKYWHDAYKAQGTAVASRSHPHYLWHATLRLWVGGWEGGRERERGGGREGGRERARESEEREREKHTQRERALAHVSASEIASERTSEIESMRESKRALPGSHYQHISKTLATHWQHISNTCA